MRLPDANVAARYAALEGGQTGGLLNVLIASAFPVRSSLLSYGLTAPTTIL